jgi:hypothetical protein
MLANFGAIGILGRLLERLWAAFAKPRLLVRLDCTKTSAASEHTSFLQRNSVMGNFRTVILSELVLIFFCLAFLRTPQGGTEKSVLRVPLKGV